MSILGQSDFTPALARPAGGVASLADIAGATLDSMLYLENSYASSDALQRVLDNRRKEIHTSTGVQLADPLKAAQDEYFSKARERSIAPFSDHWTHDDKPETLEETYNRHLETFQSELAGLAEKFPDAAQIIAADRNPWDDAAKLASQSEERLGAMMASRSGIGKYGAMLAGGMAGALADPISAVSLVFGGGPGAARTLVGKILTVAGKEALINAGTEAAIQPGVQAWRERAGLDHGLDEAIRNIAFAGAIGGAFGGAIGAAGEAASRYLRPAEIERASSAIARDARLSEPARAIPANDGLRAADSLAEIRQHLPDEARGALEAAQIMRATDQAKPAVARQDHYESAINMADQIVRNPDLAEIWPGFKPDTDQIARVVREIAGDAGETVKKAETPLIDFLIARGGIQEFKGELAAIGANNVSRRFKGRLVKETGASLDYAREAAAEARFFDHLYGDADTASNRSTVADLLNVIDEEIRNLGGTGRIAEDSALAQLESIVADIAAMAGPHVDDAIISRAARMTIDDGIDAADALERVLVGDELPSIEPSIARYGDGGIDDPTHIPDEFLMDEAELLAIERMDADMAIPFFDDEPAMTPGAFREFMETQENMAHLVEACRA